MAARSTSASSFTLPRLKTVLRIGKYGKPQINSKFWDIKFFPYAPADVVEPVFATIHNEHILICRILSGNQQPVDILHAIAVEGAQNGEGYDELNTCTWCYVNQNEPILVVAGDAAQLLLYNAVAGSLMTTLIGHGLGTINDLATHPHYPWIIASASRDASVRIWDLRRWSHQHQSTCVIICGHGQGHKEGILTVSWHASGRYLITGGHDHRICVWTIPDLDPRSSFWSELLPEHRKRSSDEVRVIHYPHFISSAVHSNYVDCVRFYGDIVISKAAEEHKLVLWEITGFNSRQPAPSSDCAPKTEDHLETRNGFIRAIRYDETNTDSVKVADLFGGRPLYERLFELANPTSHPFYIRFGLLQPSSKHPNLHASIACGNTISQIFFWDLDRLELGYDAGVDEKSNEKFRVPAKKKKTGTVRPNPQDRLSHANGRTGSTSLEAPSSPTSSQRSSSIAIFDSAFYARQSSTGATSNTSDLTGTFDPNVPNREKYPIWNPHDPLKSHKDITLADFNSKTSPFTSRAADWSPCGRWCIVVGEARGGLDGTGAVAIFERWT